MKVLFCFVLFALFVYSANGSIETCSELTDCSDVKKTKCDEMSAALQESNPNHKMVLACKNGICMCNLEFGERIIVKHEESTTQQSKGEGDKAKETTEGA